MLRAFIYFVCIIFFTNCTNKNENEPYYSLYIPQKKIVPIDTLTYQNDSLYLGLSKDMKFWQNNILITDHVNKSLWIFDEKLNLLKTFGQEGRGPKEFSFAPSIILGDSSIFLIDYTLKRLTELSVDYTYIRNYDLPVQYNYWSTAPIFVDGEFYISGSEPFSDKISDFFDFDSVIKLNSKFEAINTFFKWDKYYKTRSVYSMYNRFTLLFNGPKKSIFCLQGATNEIYHFDQEQHIIKNFYYKPKYYKNPPKTNINEVVKSIESTAEYGSKTTRILGGGYLGNSNYLLINYANWNKKSWTEKSLFEGENFIMIFDMSYNCILDEKINGIFGCIDSHDNIYIIQEEVPEKIVIVKYKLSGNS